MIRFETDGSVDDGDPHPSENEDDVENAAAAVWADSYNALVGWVGRNTVIGDDAGAAAAAVVVDMTSSTASIRRRWYWVR